MKPEPEQGAPLREAAAEAWVTAVLPGRAVVARTKLAGGYRNENILLTVDSGERFVLRRYRHDPRACAVEAALAVRLAGVVPVPELIAADPSGAQAGEPALLSRFTPGAPVADLLGELNADGARRLGSAIGTVLAQIGSIGFAQAGFFQPAANPSPTSPTSPTLTPEPMIGMALPEFAARCLDRAHPCHRLTAADRKVLHDVAGRAAPLVDAVAGASQLVHADFNPKNLLAQRSREGWEVTAVLDWEFAFSGSPLVDVGNLLRYADEHPPGFTDGFLAGFRAAGGDLPTRWREVSHALDLYSVFEFLTSQPNDASRRAAAALLREARSAAA